MSSVMLFAEGLISWSQAVDDLGITKELQPKLLAAVKPRCGKLYWKEEVKSALEKILGVESRPAFAEEGYSSEKEDSNMNAVGQIEGVAGPFERIAQGIERLIGVLVPQEKSQNLVIAVLTPAEAAKQMKLNVQTVREWCREGKLGVKAGSKWLISPDEVRHYLRGQLLIKGKVVG